MSLLQFAVMLIGEGIGSHRSGGRELSQQPDQVVFTQAERYGRICQCSQQTYEV